MVGERRGASNLAATQACLKNKRGKTSSGVCLLIGFFHLSMQCLVCVFPTPRFILIHSFWVYLTLRNLDQHFPPLTSSVFVAQVGEAPHVAQPDDGAGHRQDELYLAAPLAPLLHLLLRGGRGALGLLSAIGEAFGNVSYRKGAKGEERMMDAE